jgi:hypothetical protein
MMPFAEFWPLYLRAHRQPQTRVLHYVATVVGLSGSAAGLLMLDIVVLGIGIGGGYVLAVSAHLLFEGNRPMIAVNPVWGAAADLRMTWLAATGRLRSELDRHQIRTWGLLQPAEEAPRSPEDGDGQQVDENDPDDLESGDPAADRNRGRRRSAPYPACRRARWRGWASAGAAPSAAPARRRRRRGRSRQGFVGRDTP